MLIALLHSLSAIYRLSQDLLQMKNQNRKLLGENSDLEAQKNVSKNDLNVLGQQVQSFTKSGIS